MNKWVKLSLRFAGGLLAGVVSLVLTFAVLLGIVTQVGLPRKKTIPGGGKVDMTGKTYMQLRNSIADALDGTLAIDKVYWIADSEMVAPKPDPARFGETNDPSTLGWLLEEASELLDGQSLYFSTDTRIIPGSKVRYYLDDTILAITWKQEMDYMAFTFSEVKIAHPSQFRRFLAGGEFGSDKTFVTTKMAQDVNAVVASAGDYYRFRDVGVVVYDGTVRRVRSGYADSCYVTRKGDLMFTRYTDKIDLEYAQKFVEDNDIAFSLVFGPLIILDGEICVPRRYLLGEIDDNYPRSALCQMDELHYLIGMVNKDFWFTYTPTMDQFAWEISKTGCRHAYALDGGQTASLAFDGDLINNVMYGYQRWHSDIIYFGTAIPSADEE